MPGSVKKIPHDKLISMANKVLLMEQLLNCVDSAEHESLHNAQHNTYQNFQNIKCKRSTWNKKASAILFTEALYPGTELNRHSHYCEQDFKSCVSTSSTTRVTLFLNSLKLFPSPALLRIPIFIGTCLPVPPPG
jgi:hypothetical protein